MADASRLLFRRVWRRLAGTACQAVDHDRFAAVAPAGWGAAHVAAFLRGRYRAPVPSPRAGDDEEDRAYAARLARDPAFLRSEAEAEAAETEAARDDTRSRVNAVTGHLLVGADGSDEEEGDAVWACNRDALMRHQLADSCAVFLRADAARHMRDAGDWAPLEALLLAAAEASAPHPPILLSDDPEALSEGAAARRAFHHYRWLAPAAPGVRAAALPPVGRAYVLVGTAARGPDGDRPLSRRGVDLFLAVGGGGASGGWGEGFTPVFQTLAAARAHPGPRPAHLVPAPGTEHLAGHPAFAAWAWKALLARRCPLASRDPEDAELLHRRYLTLRAASGELSRPAAAGRDRAVLVVENRADVGTALAALCSLDVLEPGRWSVLALCSDRNSAFMREWLGPAATVLELPGFHAANFTIEAYNRIMKAPATWAAVRGTGAEKVLCVQYDGLLVRRGLERHPCFGYPYVGAPWTPHPLLQRLTGPQLVGNGGLSLRCPAEMLRVAEAGAAGRALARTYPLAPHMSEAEDVFFSRGAHPPCPRAAASGFSTEMVMNAASLGYHQLWRYHPVDATAAFFDRLERPERPARAPPL